MWCPGCYCANDEGLFHVASLKTLADQDDEDRIAASSWKKINKKDKSKDYLKGRRGDHLMVQFECDKCVFRKITGRAASYKNPTDVMLEKCIRRVLLDSFWSRASDTVTANARHVESIINSCLILNMNDPFPPSGPLPAWDHCGYAIAVTMVFDSLQGGTYSEKHKEFETIRANRKCYSNYVRATAGARDPGLVLADHDGKHYTRIGTDVCGSAWFARFIEGCKRRMGQDWRPDQPISPELLSEVLYLMEVAIAREKDETKKHRLVTFAFYYAACYVVSLRGPEGMLFDLKGMNERNLPEDTKFITMALFGKVKGEHAERTHLLPSVNVTSSGIEIKVWMKRALFMAQRQGRSTGPLMCKRNGEPFKTKELNETLHQFLGEVHERRPRLFPKDIKTVSDIEEKYKCFRSFRRGSDTRAMDKRVNILDNECVNRWRANEKAGNRVPSMPMHHRYADLSMLLGPFLRYTEAM